MLYLVAEMAQQNFDRSVNNLLLCFFLKFMFHINNNRAKFFKLLYVFMKGAKDTRFSVNCLYGQVSFV